MIAVGDSVNWMSKEGLLMNGVVKEVGTPNAEGADELKVQCQGGPMNGEIILLTSDQVSKPDASGPDVGGDAAAASGAGGNGKNETLFLGSNLWEQEDVAAASEVITKRYVTQPDPADGHVHVAYLDAEGDGITDEAMGSRNYTHTHSVVSFEVLPATGTDTVSTHPGAPQLNDEEGPMDYAEEPVAVPNVPVTPPAVPPTPINPAADLPMESRMLGEQKEEEEMKNGNGKNGKKVKKNGNGKNGEEENGKAAKNGKATETESYSDWLDRVLYEEEATADDTAVDTSEVPEEEEETPPEDVAEESFWDRFGMFEADGASTPITPTADEITTKGGGDNQAVDPPKTTAVPGPETNKAQDPIDDTEPAATSAGREVEGEQKLSAGADKTNAVESAVHSVLRGTDPKMAVRKLISESTRY